MFAASFIHDKIAFPCAICANRVCYKREIVSSDLIVKEMDVDYKKCIWIFDGELNMGDCDVDDEIILDYEQHDDDHIVFEYDMDGMIRYAFECHEHNNNASGPNNEARAFFKLIEKGRQPLYLACEELPKLSFVIKMYHVKYLYRVTDRAFDAFLKLFKRALLKGSTLAESFK